MKQRVSSWMLSSAAVAAIAFGGSHASAQGRLNVAGSPNYGERVVTHGFLPDPVTVRATSGGTLDVRAMGLGSGCGGFATSQPDLNVRFNGNASFLRFFFDGAGADATLIVNLPDGRWVCNDDASGLDPMIDLTNAGPGLYNIWVGSYRATDRITGTLGITELSNVRPGAAVPAAAPSGLDVTATPNFGSQTISPGFTPDPASVNVISGGGLDVAGENLGSGCTGWATRAPDFNVRWTGSTNLLRFFLDNVQNNADTTLIVNLPDGRWLCNDDSFGGLNPTVDVRNAGAGLYNVWVGSYRQGEQARGRLNVSELDSRHP